jgi:hypothetical protein
VAEHRVAVVARQVLGINQHRRGTLDVLPKQGPNGRALTAAVIATNSADQTRPLRDQRRRWGQVRQATTPTSSTWAVTPAVYFPRTEPYRGEGPHTLALPKVSAPFCVRHFFTSAREGTSCMAGFRSQGAAECPIFSGTLVLQNHVGHP